MMALAFVLLVFAADRATDALLWHGLARYWGLDRPAAVLCVGHSRTVLGIDDEYLEQRLGVPVAKYAVNGANIADRYAMIRHYFDLHPDSVKVVVYDVSAFTFSDRGLSSNSYKLLYPCMRDPAILQHIRANAASRDEVLWRRVFHALRYDEVTVSLAARGLKGLRANLKEGTVDLANVRETVRLGQARKMEIDPQSVELFSQTLAFIRSRGVKVVLVYIPTLDVLSDSDRTQHDHMIDMLRGYADGRGTVFIDYNRDYESRHDLFFDPIHMNGKGREVISHRLGDDLANILGKTSSNRS